MDSTLCRCSPHTTTDGVTHPGTGTSERDNPLYQSRRACPLRSRVLPKGPAMSRTWLRRAIVIVTASVVLPVTFPFAAQAAVSANAARAADPGASQLAAAMVQTDDLPTGFQPYTPLTGPLNAQRAQPLAIDLSQFGSEAKWVRTWVSPALQDEVIELAFDTGTHDDAQAAVTSVASGLLKQRAARQTVAGRRVSTRSASPSRSTAPRMSRSSCRWPADPTSSCCASTSRPRQRRRPAA